MAAEIHSRPQTARPVSSEQNRGPLGHCELGRFDPQRGWSYHAPCSCMSYHHDSRRIFIGQDNGAIVEFLISEDFNKMSHVKTYPAHQNRVSDMVFSLESQWVVSTGHDKSVSWIYDHETQHAFIGDFSGTITLLKLETQTYSTITTLKGHEEAAVLGASDHSVIMWDIGGRKGRTLLLQGPQRLRLDSDSCQKSSLQEVRQSSVWKCSSKRTSFPIMGFEFPVR
ncbi:hypothetical protein F7725_021148, partial [Dissostichus mawsoni]